MKRDFQHDLTTKNKSGVAPEQKHICKIVLDMKYCLIFLKYNM